MVMVPADCFGDDEAMGPNPSSDRAGHLKAGRKCRLVFVKRLAPGTQR